MKKTSLQMNPTPVLAATRRVMCIGVAPQAAGMPRD